MAIPYEKIVAEDLNLGTGTVTVTMPGGGTDTGNKINLATLALTGSKTYDPTSLADGAGVTTTVTVTGAVLGNFAMASFSLDLQGVLMQAWVSASNTVSVRFQNESGGVVDLSSGTLKAMVFQVP